MSYNITDFAGRFQGTPECRPVAECNPDWGPETRRDGLRTARKAAASRPAAPILQALKIPDSAPVGWPKEKACRSMAVGLQGCAGAVRSAYRKATGLGLVAGTGCSSTARLQPPQRRHTIAFVRLPARATRRNARSIRFRQRYGSNTKRTFPEPSPFTGPSQAQAAQVQARVRT